MPLKPIKTKDRLEQLKQNPLQAVKYAWRTFESRTWPEAEPFIMKHPQAAANYAIFNTHERWPEAEQYIKKDKILWKYYRDFFQFMEEFKNRVDL
jgi:hypothetical protein